MILDGLVKSGDITSYTFEEKYYYPISEQGHYDVLKITFNSGKEVIFTSDTHDITAFSSIWFDIVVKPLPENLNKVVSEQK